MALFAGSSSVVLTDLAIRSTTRAIVVENYHEYNDEQNLTKVVLVACRFGPLGLGRSVTAFSQLNNHVISAGIKQKEVRTHPGPPLGQAFTTLSCFTPVFCQPVLARGDPLCHL